MQVEAAHLFSLFENATEGFVITDDTGSIILVNPSACNMFGYNADELVGKKIELLIPQRYQPGHVQLRSNFYQQPQNRVMGHGRDLHGQNRHGQDFPVEVSLSTYVQNGRRFVIAFIVDITARKKMELEMQAQQTQLQTITANVRQLNAELEAKVEERTIILKEALQRLEESQKELSEALDKEKQLNEMKSRFVSMASHEFRTPLSTILSSATLLSKYATTDEQENRLRHIGKIKGSVTHLNDLLEDFLSLGKLDEGKVGTLTSTFSLPQAVQETAEEMRGLLKDGQQINYTHSGTEDVTTDKRMIKNMLINLLTNAIKFSDEGRPIQVTTFIDDIINIEVSDKGIGIAADDQEHLFSSFYRGKNSVNIQGTGLGLHIVKRYADLLGGTVHLTSQTNKGTTVYITLPVK